MTKRAYLSCGVWSFLLCSLLPAAPHRYKHHPNPYLYIVDIEDSGLGFLWLATHDGVYRFDGSNYTKATDYPFTDAKGLAKTDDGILWIASSDGLAKFGKSFEVVRRGESVAWLTAAGPTLLFPFGKDIWRTNAQGRMEKLQNKLGVGFGMLGADGILRYACGSREADRQMCTAKPDWGGTTERGREFPNARQFVGDSSGRLWVSSRTHLSLFQQGVERSRVPIAAKASLSVHRLRRKIGRRILFLNDDLQDLISGEIFPASEESRRFQLTAAYEDSHGRLWEARWKFGLTEWMPETHWQRWQGEEWPGTGPFHFVTQQGSAPSVFIPGGVYTLSNRGWKLDFRTDRVFRDMVRVQDELLAVDSLTGVLRLSSQGKILETLKGPSNLSLPLSGLTFLTQDAEGAFWITNRHGPVRLENIDGQFVIRGITATSFPAAELNVADIQINQTGQVWIVHNRGIERLENNKWEVVRTNKSFPTVRSFALQKKRIWLAHHASGHFSSLTNEGGSYKLRSYPAEEGYGPARTVAFFTDSRGWLWRSTPDGMYITKSEEPGPTSWIRLDPSNGLSIGLVEKRGFFEDKDGSVWLAGERGVAHIQPDEKWFRAPKPEAAPLLTELKAEPTKTRIKIGGLDANPFAYEPFQYRLLPLFDEWRSSQDGILEFPDLPQNDYRLEARYAGLGATGVLRSSFRVGTAPNYSLLLWSIPALAGLWIGSRTSLAARLHYGAAKQIFLWKQRSRFTRQAPLPGDAIPPGTILHGHFRIENTVATGGFSTVYAAMDENTGIAVAIKAASPAGPNGSWMRNRFTHEVNALRSIRHPNVVPCLESWVEPDGDLYFSMPLLDGHPLRTEISQGPLPPLRALRFAGQIAEALTAVHAEGIAHLDLKPENLIVTSSDEIILIDFGTSGLRGALDELAITRMMAGSTFYLAPERLTGHYSTASDVYSFGVVLLEMLTTRRLADFETVWYDSGFLAELSAALPGRAQKFAEHLAQCFEADPKRRPRDLTGFVRALPPMN